MRRVNPFDNEFVERNNFPDLSPLKASASGMAYGDDSGSSFSEDLEVFDDGFEDDEDIVIDAGSNSGDEGKHTHTNGQNIELDWSIDTIATLKPTEVSLHNA